MKTKKIMALLLALAMVLAFTACTAKPAPAAPAVPAADAAPAPVADAAPAEEPAAAGEDWYETPEFTLVFSVGDPYNNFMCKYMWEPWSQKVKEVTKGRVEVEMHYNGELIGTGQALTALQQGTVDIAFTAQTIDSAFKLDLVHCLANCTGTTQRLSRIYTSCLQHPDFAAPYADYKVLVLYSNWGQCIGTTDTLVEKPEDLKGLNIAVTAGTQATELGMMGASGVFCEPQGEYTALEKGIVDGLYYTLFDNMITASWGEQVKNVVMMPTQYGCNGILMCLDTWNSLPPEVQAQIDSIQDWFIDTCDQAATEVAIADMKICEDQYGTNLIWLTAEQKQAFQAIKDKVLADYIASLDAEGIDASGFLTLYKELTAEYSKPEYNFSDFDFSGPIW